MKEENKEIDKNKKTIILILGLMIFVLLAGLVLIGKIFISSSKKVKDELQVANMNILYLDEQVKRRGGKYFGG